MNIPTREDILNATFRIKKYINRTPIFTSENINNLAQCNIYFKCENFQKAGAFKSRGACNAVFSLPEKATIHGVCTHSSGNHAQALSRAALLRGIPAYVVMPENSSKVKIQAVKSYKGNITFCKPTLEARENTLLEVIKETSATEIHPYNNYTVIAGQATCALEIFEDIKNLEYLIVPVGGGGLLSGSLLSASYFSPKTKVIAAEPEQANDAYLSYKTKQFVPSKNPSTVADGLRTSLGDKTFPIIIKYVHDILTVSEHEIINATKLIWERMKIIVEPSSAVTLAAVLKNTRMFKNKTIGIILSGGNVDFDNLPW